MAIGLGVLGGVFLALVMAIRTPSIFDKLKALVNKIPVIGVKTPAA